MALSLVIAAQSFDANSIKLGATPFGGTGPYTYVWYMDIVPNFTPSGANDIPGAVTANIEVSGLIPNTIYYFKAIVTDTGHSNDTATSNYATEVTAASDLDPNQFAQTAISGQTDLMLNTNTVAMEVSFLETGIVYCGQPVKIDPTNFGGIPKVLKATADTDRIVGYVNYNPKQQAYVKGDRLQVSMAGNCIRLPAAAAITREDNVVLQANPAAVLPATGNAGKRIVGWAFDGANGPGDLIRVILATPNGALST